MNDTDSGTRSGNVRRSPRRAGGRSGDTSSLPWLRLQKITLPARVAGYVERAKLIERAMPVRRRLTVLKAPGGFGKTTLLAAVSRRLRGMGVPVAWVSVDEQDEPATLDTYVACACRSAAAGVAAGSENLAIPVLSREGSGAHGRTRIAMRQIANLDGRFVLVFDELERLESPGSAALVDFLLQHGPPNMHLAFACRRLPDGVNIAGTVLDGHAAIMSAEELRFSKSEARAFFDGSLSRAQLAEMMSESAGWPFALRVSRNAMKHGRRSDARESQEFVNNWVESRLFADLGVEERDFLLDIGLCEWMDAALIDEVLERSDSKRRIATMPSLSGLLELVRDGDIDRWRLHPLIREHCARRRYRETPQRFRAIHRRIAEALARRGQTVSAMRHAVEAGEPALAGDILEVAGGVRLCLREGAVSLVAAAKLLSDDVIATRPRLALVGCLALARSGRLQEARETYRSMVEKGSVGSPEPDASDAEYELAVDNFLVRDSILWYSGEITVEWIETQQRVLAWSEKSSRVDPMTRGFLGYGLCVDYAARAEFPTAIEWATRARRCFDGNPYMRAYTDVQEGQIAMAQGRVKDAAAHYGRAAQVARRHCPHDGLLAAVCESQLQELSLECNRLAPGTAWTSVPEVLVTGVSIAAFAAASGVVLRLRFEDEGVESALAAADELRDHARTAGVPLMTCCLSALRVSLLARAGRLDDAEEVWTSDGLPEQPADCLDLTGQNWREMEAVSCARLRLMIGRGHFEACRAFAGELRELAGTRGLTRTLMRALVLSMVLEHCAGEETAAIAHLEAYLRAYVVTPYAGPLVRERATSAQVLRAFLDSAVDSGSKETARSLLAAMDPAHDPGQPVLTAREMEVLQRLEAEPDKRIAASLNLSAYGVRYHIRKVFTKLGARNRAHAVRRAREMGLLPGAF